jgi:asparagine synthase (glutamine-hydrolysing)
MCGIAGVFGIDGRPVLPAMLGALAHRGPDDEYAVGGDDFALGARRLSIVDIAGGRQPMADETGAIWAAQNGELYNFNELREDLVVRGHRLGTRCDTEVLPHLYEEYGDRFVERLDGMFAVALWDGGRKRGVLARDRFGKKPLYYATIDGCLWFASEIKALLCVPGFDCRLDPAALHHYLSWKHVPAPFTMFRGIRALPPGHTLTFRPGDTPRIERYWRLDFAPDRSSDLNESDAVDRLLALLASGIQRRLLGDVPIGFFLSGGIDSSLTVALAAERSSSPIRTFTLTYPGEATTAGKEEDRRWARWVARRWGTEHYEETVEIGDFPTAFRSILRSFDEPFAGVVSTWFLARVIARHVKVAISGDGADELFGSYLSHRLAGPMSRWPEFVATGRRDLIEPFASQSDWLGSLWDAAEWQWRARLFVFTENEKRSLYSPAFSRSTAPHDTADCTRQLFERLTARDPVNRILEFEWLTQLPDQVLAFVDRLSMAHGLEVRSAFFDTELVRWVAALHGRWKVAGSETKILLKKAALRYFPTEMVHRPKEGFVMPIGAWLLGDLEGWVRDTLSARRLAAHGIFDAARVEELVSRFYAERGDHRFANKLIALMAFQEWYDLYRPGLS